MRDAFKAVKRNRGAAGVDKVSIQMYRANLMDNLHALMRELKDGSFEPLPLRRVFIPKNRDKTEFRPLGIPGVKDRIAQEVLRRLLDLDQLGLRFVRYADDFVVLCQNRSQAEEARTQVETLLAQLGLSLSPQKTAITSYGKGYTFLGFILSSRSRRIRPKSLEKFKDKVRAITIRKHNLDLELVDHLNALIRGVAQYFCAPFATNREQFHKLDSWIRMRLRAMKFKRKNTLDNYKLRIRTFQQTYRLLDLESFYVVTHAPIHRSPSRGSSSRSRPATETVTPVNLWN